jgi:hypothetical protein
MTDASLEDNFDVCKVAIMDALATEGFVTKEAAEEWCATHTVILRKKGVFRTLTEKWKLAPVSPSLKLRVVKSVIGEE